MREQGADAGQFISRGCGKSNLALQLALTVQLPVAQQGIAGGAIYITSEGHLPTNRLISMAESLLATSSDAPDEPEASPCSPLPAVRMLDNIHVIKALDIETLELILSYRAPRIVGSSQRQGTTQQPAILPIRLIIVDSIAAPFRASPTSGSASLVSRAIDLGRIGDSLKQLANRFNCAVVVINQASDVFTLRPLNFTRLDSAVYPDLTAPLVPNGDFDSLFPPPRSQRPLPKYAHEQYRLPERLYSRHQSPYFSGQSDHLRKIAALGLTWTNVINERIMLSRTRRKIRTQLGPEDEVVRVRRMDFIFSPSVPHKQVEYVVESAGVRVL